jgi:hypothetical protein
MAAVVNGPGAPAAGPRAGEPAEMAPQAARTRPIAVTKTKSSRRLRPGDLICGECGEGNDPARKFCSRCGNSLVAAEIVKMPWWRRLLPRRGPRTVAIGDQRRPGGTGVSVRKAGPDIGHGLRRAYRIARLAVGVAALCAATLYGAFPPFRNTVNGEFTSVRQKASNIVNSRALIPVHAVKVTANLQVAGHPGTYAVDEYTNTYWLAPWSSGHEPVLTLDFGRAVTLERMILYSGASGNYTADSRPATLNLIFSNNESYTVVPDDTPDQQTLTIHDAIQVNSVQIQIGSVYPGLSSSDVGISDIELFALKVP